MPLVHYHEPKVWPPCAVAGKLALVLLQRLGHVLFGLRRRTGEFGRESVDRADHDTTARRRAHPHQPILKDFLGPGREAELLEYAR